MTKKEMLALLKKADEQYYNQEKSDLTDKQYDELKDEFTKQYPEHEYSKQVGAKVSSSFVKVKHSIEMGSQSKVNSFEELNEWAKKYAKDYVFNFLVSEKVDGFSLSLIYKKGKLHQAITRGDGIEGEDVTENVKKIKLIPHEIKSKKDQEIFRGEAVLFISDFNDYFSDKANPRNAAAGTIRRLDGERCEHLSFLCYDIVDESLETEAEKFEKIKKLGFTSPEYFICKDLEAIEKIHSEYENGKRVESSYEMDGLVVCMNQIQVQKELGIIDQRPRYSRAYKFSAEEKETVLEDVSWFVGRTGRITPVGKVTPVEVSGVVISNVTLHNLSEIKRLDLTLGCKISLKRAGDVIPKVEQVLNKTKNPIVFPSHCPSCANKTYAEDVFLVCRNKKCPAQEKESLNYWIKSLDIKGIGEELVAKLYDLSIVNEPRDFYTLTAEVLESLDRQGEKSSKKAIQAIHAKKDIPLAVFIKALGIANISEKTAELILEKFDSLEKILDADEKELSNIHGIGPIVAKNIKIGLKERKKIIENVSPYLNLIKKEKKEGIFSGKSFCFTGFRSKELEAEIENKGGKIASGVSKTLSYLVVKSKEESSSKSKKASELGISIIDESDLKKMLK